VNASGRHRVVLDGVEVDAPAPDDAVVDGRVIGLDLGERRIGVAVSDDQGRLALPSEVLQRDPDQGRIHRRIRDLVEEFEAVAVVVGVPLSLDGSTGPAARRIEAEIAELRGILGVPVFGADERFSTAEAHQHLRRAGLDERARRAVVDAAAAAAILQGWLDRRRHCEDGTR